MQIRLNKILPGPAYMAFPYSDRLIYVYSVDFTALPFFFLLTVLCHMGDQEAVFYSVTYSDFVRQGWPIFGPREKYFQPSVT
jgi:hypothetical protein